MQMLKNIFNSKEKYYLELDEALESKPAKAVAKTATKVSNTVKEKAAEVAESKPVEKAVEAASKTKEAVEDKLETVTKTESAKPKGKTSIKDKANKKGKVSAEGKPDKTDKPQKPAKLSPKDAGASSFDPPFWVAAMYNSSSTEVNSDGTQAEPTFAADNLMPTVTKYRRRPGPSLNNFKDMAKKAKTPKG